MAARPFAVRRHLVVATQSRVTDADLIGTFGGSPTLLFELLPAFAFAISAGRGRDGGPAVIGSFPSACGGRPGPRVDHHDVFDAQADFGEALVVIDGVECKAHYLVVDLPHSDDAFVQAFPAETTEAFCEGHNAAFRYFGGVPRGIVYDNTTLAVAKILGDGTRQRTQSFSELHSHYLFDDRFGRRGRATTKARWKGWSATPAETSSCRSRASLVGTR